MADSSKSEFVVVSNHGVISTKKDNEFVQVQVVRASGREWMEARVNYVDRSSGDLRGTKSALMFDDVEDVTALIEALTEMRDAYKANPSVPVAPAFQVRKPSGVNTNGVAARRSRTAKTA